MNCNDTGPGNAYGRAGAYTYSKTEYSFGQPLSATGARLDLTQTEPFQAFTPNQKGPDLSVLLESRTGAAFRAVMLRTVTEATDKG